MTPGQSANDHGITENRKICTLWYQFVSVQHFLTSTLISRIQSTVLRQCPTHHGQWHPCCLFPPQSCISRFHLGNSLPDPLLTAVTVPPKIPILEADGVRGLRRLCLRTIATIGGRSFKEAWQPHGTTTTPLNNAQSSLVVVLDVQSQSVRSLAKGSALLLCGR